MVAVYTGIGILIGWLLLQYLLVPYIKLEMDRRKSRQHVPQPEELWLQNGDTLLYIDSVGPNGVSIIHYDGSKANVWTDSWAEWQQRSEVHTLVFTGRKQPLGPA